MIEKILSKIGYVKKNEEMTEDNPSGVFESATKFPATIMVLPNDNQIQFQGGQVLRCRPNLPVLQYRSRDAIFQWLQFCSPFVGTGIRASFGFVR